MNYFISHTLVLTEILNIREPWFGLNSITAFEVVYSIIKYTVSDETGQILSNFRVIFIPLGRLRSIWGWQFGGVHLRRGAFWGSYNFHVWIFIIIAESLVLNFCLAALINISAVVLLTWRSLRKVIIDKLHFIIWRSYWHITLLKLGRGEGSSQRKVVSAKSIIYIFIFKNVGPLCFFRLSAAKNRIIFVEAMPTNISFPRT